MGGVDFLKLIDKYILGNEVMSLLTEQSFPGLPSSEYGTAIESRPGSGLGFQTMLLGVWRVGCGEYGEGCRV